MIGDQGGGPPTYVGGPTKFNAGDNWYAAELHAARQKYLRDWTIVKRARFNAAKRCERKQNASVLAFAIAGIVGFVLPFFVQLFGSTLAPHTKSVLEFYGYITGALSLCVGLVEQARGYDALARRFNECGRKVNSVLRQLRNNPALDEGVLGLLVKQYEQALDTCDVNHDDIDRNIALAEEDCEAARAGIQKNPKLKPLLNSAASELGRCKRSELVQIYWLYWLILAGPTILALVIWFVLAPPS